MYQMTEALPQVKQFICGVLAYLLFKEVYLCQLLEIG